ncbi:MAG: hypothetical protein J1F65_00010 [Clostridiales bacterium]|nr:hypothetical protein [Clostridiales bacterium]
MHKRIDFLDDVKEKYLNSGDAECYELLQKLYEYYRLRDKETNGQHSEIFRALYMQANIRFDEISKNFYINTYTLDRYRQRYNNLALKIAAAEFIAKLYPTKTVR